MEAGLYLLPKIEACLPHAVQRRDVASLSRRLDLAEELLPIPRAPSAADMAEELSLPLLRGGGTTDLAEKQRYGRGAAVLAAPPMAQASRCSDPARGCDGGAWMGLVGSSMGFFFFCLID